MSDDPELMRIKANTKIISNVAYHGDLEKKALMEQQRNLGGDGDTKNKNGVAPPKSPSSYMDELSSLPTSSHPSATSHHNYNSSSHGSSASYNRSNSHGDDSAQGYSSNSRQYQASAQQQQSHHPPSNNASHHNRERERDPYQKQQQASHHQQQHGPGHYVPPPQPQQQQQQYNPSPYSSRGQANVIYTSEGGAGLYIVCEIYALIWLIAGLSSLLVNANASRKVGSISDYDPMNNYYGSIEQQRAAQAQAQAQVLL